jgi:hypothetical protein
MKTPSCGDALTEHGAGGVEMIMESPERGLLRPSLPLTNSCVAGVPVFTILTRTNTIEHQHACPPVQETLTAQCKFQNRDLHINQSFANY